MLTNFFDKIVSDACDKESVKVLLTAPTGIAAFLIGGTTIHNAFKLPIGNRKLTNLSENIANSIYSYLRHVEIVIIDEISMVSNHQLALIDQRMQDIFRTTQMFGGKTMIFVGDLLQLPPVRAQPIYRSVVENKEEADITDYYRDLLWRSVRFFELKQVVRQKDAQYIKILGELAKNQLTKESFDILKTRHVKDDEVPIEAVRLFYTNKQVNEFNKRAMTNAPGDEHISTANDLISRSDLDEKSKQRILNEFKVSDDNNQPRSLYKLSLKKGIF